MEEFEKLEKYLIIPDWAKKKWKEMGYYDKSISVKLKPYYKRIVKEQAFANLLNPDALERSVRHGLISHPEKDFYEVLEEETKSLLSYKRTLEEVLGIKREKLKEAL
jgi:hypothetical protein